MLDDLLGSFDAARRVLHSQQAADMHSLQCGAISHNQPRPSRAVDRCKCNAVLLEVKRARQYASGQGQGEVFIIATAQNWELGLGVRRLEIAPPLLVPLHICAGRSTCLTHRLCGCTQEGGPCPAGPPAQWRAGGCASTGAYSEFAWRQAVRCYRQSS